MKTNLFILTMLLPILLFSQKENVVTATITSVTIYTASAELHYEKEIPLTKGKNIIVFKELTPWIVENTVNVSSATPGVDIVTVNEKINYITKKKATGIVKSLNDSITILQNKLGLYNVQNNALEAERGLLFKDESIGGVSEGVAVSEIEKASMFFRKRYLEISTQLFELSKKITDLNQITASLKKQITQNTTAVSSATSEIRMVVNAATSGKANFNFRFLTSKGGWAPYYDIKYNGPDAPLFFIFRANVFNACGIAWDNVKIKLSTANPVEGFHIPGFNDAVPEENENTNNSPVKFKRIEVVNSIAEYDIQHVYSIPSDAKPYLVDVNGFSIPADFSYFLVPKLEPYGFLMADIPNWNKYNLIPGTTNIYNKGTYMGKTYLNTYAENDTLNVYLGKDHSIQTTWKNENDYHGHKIIGNYVVEENNISVSIKSNLNKPTKIRIVDQVPIIDESEEKMTLQGIDAASYTKNEGALEWQFTIEANTKMDLAFGYKIKTQKDYYSSRPKKRMFRTISCPSF